MAISFTVVVLYVWHVSSVRIIVQFSFTLSFIYLKAPSSSSSTTLTSEDRLSTTFTTESTLTPRGTISGDHKEHLLFHLLFSHVKSYFMCQQRSTEFFNRECFQILCSNVRRCNMVKLGCEASQDLCNYHLVRWHLIEYTNLINKHQYSVYKVLFSLSSIHSYYLKLLSKNLKLHSDHLRAPMIFSLQQLP